MRALPLGRVFGVPLRMRPSTPVLAVLLALVIGTDLLPAAVPGQPPAAYAVAGVATAALFVAGVVVHELAHVAAARRHGVGVRGLTFGALRGATELESPAPTPLADLEIAVSGPLASIGVAALASAAAMLAGGIRLAATALVWLAAMNAFLGAVNLLPGPPLDGAHAMRALIWWRTGDRLRAAALADRVGRSLGVAMGALGVVLLLTTTAFVTAVWIGLLGSFIAMTSAAEETAVRSEHLLGELTVGDAMGPAPPAVPEYLTPVAGLRQLVVARREVMAVVDLAGRAVGTVTATALDRLAQAPPVGRRPPHVRDAVLPLVTGQVAAPDECLVEALRRAGGRPIVVVCDGAVAGIVPPGDVA